MIVRISYLPSLFASAFPVDSFANVDIINDIRIIGRKKSVMKGLVKECID